MTWARSLLWGLLLKLAACGALGCTPAPMRTGVVSAALTVQAAVPACIAVTAAGCIFATSDPDTGTSCCRQVREP